MRKITSFTKGKSEERNEDFFGYNENTFVIADGLTDKSWKKYNGKTWGEIASRLVVEKCLSSNFTGPALIDYINRELHKVYISLGIIDDTQDPKYRFGSMLICGKIHDGKITITSIGDSWYRINGTEIHEKVKQEDDIEIERERAEYIKRTWDIEGSREHILPLLMKQFEQRNNPDHPLWYGIIDGTDTPHKFIEVREYNEKDSQLLELFTDGYFAVPQWHTIQDWEDIYEKIEKEDPYKYLAYPSTKSKDDRTIMIVQRI